jgi:CRISPR-associated protein Cas1
LEPSVGFLHDFSNYQTKQSLVYDLQELFRWIIDLTVMKAFESGALDHPHFYFTGDDYRYRFDVEAKIRFLNLLREKFNSGVNYKGRVSKWDALLEQKATELSHVLVGRNQDIDFVKPTVLTRSDSLDIRNRILSISMKEGCKLGINKSTMHYLHKRVGGQNPFLIYAKTRNRLNSTVTPRCK